MKHRYFTPSGTEARAREEELVSLIPESAVEEANDLLDAIEPTLEDIEVKERELIVRSHDRFEICCETNSDYRTYEFAYNPLTGEVKYIRMEGDFK